VPEDTDTVVVDDALIVSLYTESETAVKLDTPGVIETGTEAVIVNVSPDEKLFSSQLFTAAGSYGYTASALT
jgi:hypothetical protein